MIVPDCFRMIAQELHRADRTNEAMSLPRPSQDDTRTWPDWQHELDTRVNRLASSVYQDGRPSMRLLACLAAQVVATMLALARVQEAELASSDELDAA